MSHNVETTPTPATGWTPERKVHFLDRLSVHGNARAACRAVGLSAEAAYKLRRRDAQFARGWAAALVLARENGLQVLGERAIEGIEEEIYYRGELIGTRRRYDSRLLLAHLARLDQLADDETAGVDAGRFDELIAAIAGELDYSPAASREEHIEQAARDAENTFRNQQMEAYFAERNLSEEDIGWSYQFEPGFEDELESSSSEVAEQARRAAELDWEDQRETAIAAVDYFIECRAPTVAIGLPSSSAAGAANGGDGPPSRGCGVAAVQSSPPLSFVPWTLSTASTGSIARGLAAGPPGWQTTPRSPFTAPREPSR